MAPLQRYECKYLVPESVAQRVVRSAAPFLVPDPYAARRPGFTYPICSLYLDSEDLRLYRETREGLRTRFKLRIRAYSDDAAVPLLFEIKRRADRIVHKTRTVIPRTALAMLVAGRQVALRGMREGQRVWLDEFVRLMLATRARPRVLVRYDREAYVGAADPDVRVTLDRRLRAADTSRAEVRMDGPAFRSVGERSVILELKFNQRCPAWLLQLVQRFELRRTSYSKYCAAIDCTLGRQAIVTS